MSDKYSIVDTVLQCAYPSKMRDYIANVIIEVTTASKTAKVLKVKFKNEDITAVKYNVAVTFKSRSYDIGIVIYLTKNMPYEAPEIYLERNSDTGVNPKNIEIDQKTNRILTQSLINWNSYSTLTSVITEITASFNKNFPIYKLTSSTNSTSTTTSNTNSFYNQPMTNSYVQPNNYNPNLTNSYYNPNPNNNQGVNYNTMNKSMIPGYNTTNTSNTINTIPIIPSIIPNTTINPNSYLNLCNNLGKQPPHQNTIYHNLYQGNNNYSNQNPNYNSMNTSQVPMNSNNNNFNTGYNSLNNTNINNSLYSNQNVNTNTNTNLNNNYNNNFTNTNTNLTKPIYTNTNNNNDNTLLDPKICEAEIKKILIAEIRANIESKVKEEMKRNKQTEDKLKNFKNEFIPQIEKYQKFLARREEIKKGLKNLLETSENELQVVQSQLAKLQDKVANTSTFVIENNVYISNSSLLNIFAIEATFEDFMSIIRKSFEKGVLNINETTKIIRTLTREAFRIKFYRDKLIKKI